MIAFFLSVANAEEPPCGGHVWDDRIHSEHFWVEWQPDAASAERAEKTLAVLESSRTIYADGLGWEEPNYPILAEVVDGTESLGAAGRCITQECDGLVYPQIDLFPAAYRDGYSTVAHELAHAFQYAYMGPFIDSMNSWIWWMEGTATWITVHSGEDNGAWASAVSHYLGVPHLRLHHGVDAFFDADRSGHMYGTAILAQFIEEHYGGPDAVRRTWELGAARTGEPIWFPDIVEEMGVEWDAFWAHYLAIVSVVDLPGADDLTRGPERAFKVTRLPDAGTSPPALTPEALGMAFVLFKKEAGSPGASLEVSFEGDSSVKWHAVLVTADGARRGSAVRSYERLQLTNGSGSARLPEFDGSVTAVLVVSPETQAAGSFSYSWSADLVTSSSPAKSATCGCQADATAETSTMWSLASLLRRW